MLKQDLMLTKQEIEGLINHIERVDAPPDTPLQPQAQNWMITQNEFLCACVIAAIVILLFLK